MNEFDRAAHLKQVLDMTFNAITLPLLDGNVHKPLRSIGESKEQGQNKEDK